MAKEIRVLELFAGIGACSKAFTNLGIPHKIVDAVEIDKYAIKSFNAIHNTNFEPQDISQWDKDLDVDLIMHGSPCQDFSVAGKQAGGDEGSGTRSSLMYETLRIVEKLKPKYVIWENVKNLLSKKHRHNFDAYLKSMEDLGYHNDYKVLNAKDYGIPQNRERVFTVSIRNDLNVDFKFPESQTLNIRLKDVLEPQVDEKYYLSDEQTKRLKMTTYNSGPEKVRVQDTDGEARTLCARDYKDPKCVRVGGLYDKNGSRHQAGSIYDPNGVCATLSTMQGGNQEPIIVASRGRNPDNPSDRSVGQKLEQRLEPNRQGITNTITSVQKDNYVAVLIDDTYKNREPREYEEYSPTLRAGRSGLKVITANKQGVTNTTTSVQKDNYVAEPQIIDAKTTRGADVASTIRASIHKQGSRNLLENIKNGRGYEGVAIRTANKKGYDMATDGDGVDLSYPQSKTRRGRVGHGVSKTLMGADSMGTVDNYRIRKLTPKECWRLMGFDDADFEKAEKVNSNTQLYKQAGNSIVVNVLEGILCKLPIE